MAQLSPLLRSLAGGQLAFWCPGCNEPHAVAVGEGPGPRWTYNGNPERPTFTPSVLVTTGHYVSTHNGELRRLASPDILTAVPGGASCMRRCGLFFFHVFRKLTLSMCGPIAAAVWIMALSSCAPVPAPASAPVQMRYPMVDDRPIRDGDVKGCFVSYNAQTGKFLYEPFLKVQNKEYDAESGASEVWGFRLWNLEPPDADGLTHPVNIPAAQFIPADGVAHEVPAGTLSRFLKCDMFSNWQARAN